MPGVTYRVWRAYAEGTPIAGRSKAFIAGFAHAQAWLEDGAREYVYAVCKDGSKQWPSRMLGDDYDLSGYAEPQDVGSVCGAHKGLARWAIKKSPVRYTYGSVCRDGWLSDSTGRGTCSWHGGVDHVVQYKWGGDEKSGLVK